jgi:hypothetical protein
MWFRAEIKDTIPLKSVGFNFMPSWWYRTYGFEYGEKMIFDPEYRIAIHQAMRRVMAERFASAKLGEPDPKPLVVGPDWENAVIGALCGCDVEYPADNYPLMRHMSDERIESLAVPDDLWAVFPYNEILRQFRAMNGALGTDAAPAIPTRGILNEAVLLRGDALVADMFLDPPAASRLLDFSFSLMKAQIAANARFGGAPVMLTNCTVPMVGPATYGQILRKYDDGIARHCEGQGVAFAMHHCGNLDQYIGAYRSLSPRFAFLDIGHESSLRAALAAFPEADISLIVSTHLLRTGSAAAVGEKIDQILDESRGHWHRLMLNIADIDVGTPDENILAVYESLKRAI